MSHCIICLEPHSDETVEHIVPRALGNIHYVLRKGLVCQRCNQRFSRYENSVLNSPLWLKRRKEYGLVRNVDLKSMGPSDESTLRRFLSKILYEAMFQSRKKLVADSSLEEVRKELAGGPQSRAVIIENKALGRGSSIPGWIEAWRLKRNHIHLKYELSESFLWFELRFSDIYTILKIPR